MLGLLTAILTAAYLLCFRAADAPRSTVTFAILLGAALFNTGLTATRWKTTPRPNQKWLYSALFLSLMTVGGNIALGVALEQLGPGVTSTMMQLQVFFIAVGAWLLLRERVGILLVFGAGLALIGFSFFALPSGDSARLPLVGLACGVLTALCFSGMIIWTRAVISRLDPVSLNAGRLWIAVAGMALWPGMLRNAWQMPWQAWALSFAAAALGPFLGRLCVMYSLRFIGAAQTKLWGMLSPVFAFFFVYLVYGTLPTQRAVLGGLLIVSGVLLPTLSAFWKSRSLGKEAL